MSPSVNHSYIQARLVILLGEYKHYSVFTELSLDIDGKEYVPDIFLYIDKKINLLEDEIRTKDVPLTVIEILSPTQNVQELVDKFKIYFLVGSLHRFYAQ